MKLPCYIFPQSCCRPAINPEFSGSLAARMREKRFYSHPLFLSLTLSVLSAPQEPTIMKETIVLATSNAHKLRELSEAAETAGIDLRILGEFDTQPLPEETGTTFEENALIKAKAAYSRCERPVLAEDSGLEVRALGGEPGIYSARYCGAQSDDERIDCLLRRLDERGDEDRYAEFVCCMVYIDSSGDSHIFEGRCEGQITASKRGENGFGYDPVFFIPELDATMAELEEFEKNLISHRAHAFAAFIDYYRQTR